ncbi:hypothetical protein KFV81_03510 [Klebsiella pneumoniae]|uniref:hypothetical protein n=1 Tax=Klebsiella pneumoniae TaxID=573 RepID=UPI001BA4FC52|nr:hypothetical protein [Klebsiella pneumoniae]MBS2822732.1 hypothetical protein [Klebsiella pneumoniae]
MTTYKTGNPLGSAAVKDLFDNAENLDHFENDRSNETWENRFGVPGKTRYGMEQEHDRQISSQEARFQQFLLSSGYVFLGDYENGPHTIDVINQVIRYQGEFWRLNAATNPPYTTTGVNSTSWTTDVTHLVSVGDATLRQELASTTGADMTGYLLGTVSRKLGEVVSVQDFMTNAEIIDANSPTGTMDHSHAFISAFAASRTVYVPPVLGQYRVANVTIPKNTTMYGYSTLIYNGYEDVRFNGKGSVIRKLRGADRMFLWETGCLVLGIIFDGADRSCSLGLDGSFTAHRCGFYRFERVGNDYGKYCGMLLDFCNINQNTVGLYNLIDSRVANSTINANKNDGVYLGTGANNNSFINTRNEWNLGNNYSAYGSTENSVIGEMCDAAGKNGFFAGGGASWNIIGTRVKRSGRQATTAEDNAHFRIQDSGSEIILNGVKTYSGVNDGGSGSPSPLVNVYAQGGSTNMRFMATNCDMSGYVNRAMVQSTNIDSKRILNCVGMEDLVTDGFRKIANGKSYLGYRSLNITGAATSTISFTQPPIDNYSRAMRRVEIAGRITNTGATETCILDLVFIREGGNASAVITNIQGYPSGRFAASGTEVSVAISDVSADASTFSLQFTTTGTNNRNYAMYLV